MTEPRDLRSEPRGHAWLHRDLHGHRIAVGDGFVCFADHDEGAAPLAVLAGLVAFPLAWAAFERAAGLVSPSLAKGALPGALAMTTTLAVALAWRARRRRALDADPRGTPGSWTFDAKLGALVEPTREGPRTIARGDELTLGVREPDVAIHGFSGTYALLLATPTCSRVVAEAPARAAIDELARALADRGLGSSAR